MMIIFLRVLVVIFNKLAQNNNYGNLKMIYLVILYKNIINQLKKIV